MAYDPSHKKEIRGIQSQQGDNDMQKKSLVKVERRLINVLLAVDLIFFLQKSKKVQTIKEKHARDKRVRKLMKKAYDIPFYHARFDSAGLKPEDFKCAEDLYKFPLLTKDDLRAWMDEEVGKEQYEDYYLDTTSGSSGTPTRVYYSPKEKAYNMANWVRVLIRAGYNPVTGLTASRLSAHSVSAGQKNIFQKLGFLRREFINQYAPEPDVIEQINEIKPDLLYMNKTELMRVALYAKKHDIKVHHPKLMVPTGEMIDDNARKLFTEIFGDCMIDAYGAAEIGSCMTKYPGSSYWRIQGDLFAVNICDDLGNEAEEGNLCITPLYRTDFPLINYLVGDRARAGKAPDGSRVIVSVLGRSNDFISHANGDVTTFFMIAPIFAHSNEIVQVRLVEKSYDDLIIQAVASENMTDDEKKAVESRVTEQMNEKLKAPMNISFEWMPVIPPDENGKLRLIVNEMRK